MAHPISVKDSDSRLKVFYKLDIAAHFLISVATELRLLTERWFFSTSVSKD